jgi:hypothetical protein
VRKQRPRGNRKANAAENELKAAWTKVEAEQHKLQSASAEGWESAKISFEKASHDLKEAWDKIRPAGDK